MTNEIVRGMINSYEEKLRNHDASFTLSPFERLIMEDSIKFGYELREKEENNDTTC